MPPAIAGGVAPSTPMGDLLAQGAGPAGDGQDQVREQITQVMRQLLDVQKQIDQIAGTMPALGEEAKQMRQSISRMIAKASQQAPVQSASSQAVPGGLSA